MGLPYENEDYGGADGGGGASTVNDLGGMNFSTLSDNEIMKRVDSNNVGGTNIINVLSTAVGNVSSNSLTYYDGDGDIVSGIRHVKDDSIVLNAIHKVNILPNALEGQYLTILHSEGDAECRVGINVVDPEEALHIAGTARIDNDSTQSLTFYDTGGGNTRQHGRIELVDNGGGADMKFYTRPSGGTEPTDKLTINKDGALGLGATPDFGVAGNFLMSGGPGAIPEWFVPTTRIITSVKKTISQSFTSGAVTKITGWDTPHVDIGTTGWSNVDSRYTIQRTGTYRIDLKAIISNTGNDGAQLRYLNIGIYIYNSGGGAPVIQDLDTTVLVNVDSTPGNAERGSGDYTIIRTLNATQYIEIQVGSLQATGNYDIESAVFNIEEVSAYHVDGVGQFLQLTGGTVSGSITAPTYKTTALPTLTTEIGYNQTISVAQGVTIPKFDVSPFYITFATFSGLTGGVYMIVGSFATDGITTYGTAAILNDGISNIHEQLTVVVPGGYTSNYVSHIFTIPYGTTKSIEFRSNVNTTTTIQTIRPSECSVVRIA